jgi:DNA-binding NarL/FixJ family response regulator
LIAEGYTNKAIADTLFITIKTVEKHRASVMAKLNLQDMAGLVRVAIKHGLIFLDD